MSKKNIYEVFDDFKAAKSKKDRIDVLRRNDTWALRQVLIGTFYKGVEFAINDIPEWKRDLNMPAGMGYNNMTQVLDKIYLFMKNNPRTPAGLTDKRRTELFIGILKKDQKVPYLTEALVNEAFEGLLPQS